MEEIVLVTLSTVTSLTVKAAASTRERCQRRHVPYPMGWYGGSAARLMAYVPKDENLASGEVAKQARWVTIHQLNTCDRIPFPSLDPNLSMTFRVTKDATSLRPSI